jgi:HSP20 family protein
MVYLMPNKETFSFPLRLSNEVQRLFDEMIHRPWGRTRELRTWSPSVDLYETDDGYVLEADLPGVKTEDVRIDIDGNEFILQGRRVMETSLTRKRFHIIERCTGEFLRRIYLPESVDKEDIQTEFTDGVLRVLMSNVKNKKAGHF